MIRLDHGFRLPLPPDRAFTVLTDLPRVARCLPGAHLDAAEGGRHEGRLSARLGPISAEYRGSAYLVERDDVGHTATIEARGREVGGTGTASALITFALRADGDATEVTVTSELAVGGRAARLGRGPLAEAGSSMLGTFVENLDAIEARAAPSAAAGPAVRTAGPSANGATADTTRTGPDGRPDGTRASVAAAVRRSGGYVIGTAIGLLAGVVIGRSGRRGT